MIYKDLEIRSKGKKIEVLIKWFEANNISDIKDIVSLRLDNLRVLKCYQETGLDIANVDIVAYDSLKVFETELRRMARITSQKEQAARRSLGIDDIVEDPKGFTTMRIIVSVFLLIATICFIFVMFTTQIVKVF